MNTVYRIFVGIDIFRWAEEQSCNEIYIREAAYVEPYEKSHGNKVAGPSRDIPLTFKQYFFDVPTKSEVRRPSADCQTTVFRRFSNWKNFWKKSLNGHATVVRGHATVGRLSNNVFGRFKQLGKFLKKVAERSRDSGQRSRDRRPTVEQRFWAFQAIKKNFEKSHWTVTRQRSEVTRPSAECQTTFFGRSKQLGKILKKVTERSRDSGRWSRDRRSTVKQRFWTFQAIMKNFEKSHWTVTRQWMEVTRPSADCQTSFFGRFKQLGKFLKKVTERSRDSGRRSRDRRPTVKQHFLDVSSN